MDKYRKTDKQYVVDSLLHCVVQSYPMFVPNFKILSQVVSEKSLTEKKLTNMQTYKQKKQKLYTPYILCMPGV